MEIKVMSFNVCVFASADHPNSWENRLPQVAQVIEQSQAAVVGTQELRGPMLAEIQQLLPAYHSVSCGRDADREGENNAILYRQEDWQLLASDTFWLSETPEIAGSKSWETSLPRICTWVVLQSRHDPTYSFAMYNTHFDHLSEAARQASAGLVWRKIQENHAHLPVVLTGDFNAAPDSEAIAFLNGVKKNERGEQSSLSYTYQLPTSELLKMEGTFHQFSGKGDEFPVIDYIFTSPSIIVSDTCVFRDQVDGKYPSDHFPVTSTLILPPNK